MVKDYAFSTEELEITFKTHTKMTNKILTEKERGSALISAENKINALEDPDDLYHQYFIADETEQKCIEKFNEIIDEFEKRLFDDVIWKERFGILFHKEVKAQVIRFKQKLNSK